MKKILSVLLILSMLASLLTACKTSKPTSEEATTEETVQAPEDLVLFDRGKTSFRIVYNQMESVKNPSIESNLNELVETVQKYTGIKLKMVPASKNTYNADAYEILIGSTGYEESLSVAKELRLTDYKIARVGNKIVIAGGNIGSLASAIRWGSG